MLISILLSPFSGVLSDSFIWKVTPHLLILSNCVCFCVVGISATSPGLEAVVLGKRCSVGPRAQSPWSPESAAPGAPSPLCGLHVPSCVAEPGLLWVCSLLGLVLTQLAAGLAVSAFGRLMCWYCGFLIVSSQGAHDLIYIWSLN